MRTSYSYSSGGSVSTATAAPPLPFPLEAPVRGASSDFRAPILTIRDYLGRVRVENSAYYNMEKGWCVIEQPLRQ
jgi:hypothetical protein